MTDSTPQPYFPQDLENYAPWVAKYGLRYPYGECQCGCQEKTSISAKGRSRDYTKKGHPVRFVWGHTRIGCFDQPTLKDAFLARVTPRDESDCWIWEGSITAKGYGVFKHGDTHYRAHRASYLIYRGPIPDGVNVCHNCPSGDNPLCVNPAHLWLGDHIANQRDKIKKDRQAKGETQGSVKLTEDDIRHIRHLAQRGERYAHIAKTYQIDASTASDIARRKSWKHIP